MSDIEAGIAGEVKTFLRNARSFHHRVMARFLRNRGWVVFYLEEEARVCANDFC